MLTRNIRVAASCTALVCVIAALFSNLSLRAGDKKKDDAQKGAKKEEKKTEGPTKAEPILSKTGELKATDEKDTKLKQSPRKLFPIKLVEGKVYQIDLKSKDFDAYLRLEDPAGEQVAFNDDLDASTTQDSRIVYKAAKSGDYKIIVTSFDKKAGNFSLAVVEVSDKAPLLTGSRFQGKAIALKLVNGKVAFTGEFTEADPSHFKRYYKLFTIRLEKGQIYRIDHRSRGDDPKFDPYLVLEDTTGALLEIDDDGGDKALDARIVFQPAETGTYRIIATTVPVNQIGRFVLEVGPDVEAKKGKK